MTLAKSPRSRIVKTFWKEATTDSAAAAPSSTMPAIPAQFDLRGRRLATSPPISSRWPSASGGSSDRKNSISATG
jgi:hypothetical protein